MVLITVALMAPAIAEAKSIKIWPDQLIPMAPNGPAYQQDVSHVESGDFYVPLTLPAGARITKITYYHCGIDRLSPTAITYLVIFRVKMGSEPEELGIGSSTDLTGVIIPVDVEPTGDRMIRAGYRYYIEAYSGNEGSFFMGVKIDYQE